MATPPKPIPANIPEPYEEPEVVDPATEALSSALREEMLNEFLGNYQPKGGASAEADRLNHRYTIFPNQALPQFDTSNAKAYLVQDDKQSDKRLYALVCEKHLPVRRALARKLLAIEPSPLIRLVGEGIAHISSLNEERYILIYEQPLGKPLIDIINSQQQAFPDRYVRNLVITPLNEALKTLVAAGFAHGRVNPNNIYIHENQLTLGECCSEPFGYSQDFHYEPINYIQASPAGKGMGIPQVDYHALGCVTALMKLKPKAFQITDRTMFLRRLLQEGSYIGIAGYIDLSDEMNDLLRGTFNDNAAERWTSKQVTEWCKGKRYNLLSPTIQAMGTRPFEIADETFNNLRQLADGVHRHREEAAEVFRDTSLGRWVEVSTRRREVTEHVQRITKSYRNPDAKALNEMVTRCMLVLDRAAPIRLKSVSMLADGAPVLLADIYHQKDNEAIDELKDAIMNSLLSEWQECQKVAFGIAQQPDIVQQAIWLCDRSRTHVRNNELGFGMERLLYDLNPALPCQSSILKRHYVDELTGLLRALDRVATTADKPTVPMDRHIAGFIGAKTTMNQVMVFSDYSAYPQLAMHPGLIALKLLQKAQLATRGEYHPGLAAWVVASITDAIGVFFSKTVRKAMCEQLSALARTGDLTAILEYLAAYDYSQADAQGFMAATQQYADMSTRIKGLNNKDLLEFRSFRLGNIISKYLGYAVLIGMIIYYFNLE